MDKDLQEKFEDLKINDTKYIKRVKPISTQ